VVLVVIALTAMAVYWGTKKKGDVVPKEEVMEHGMPH